MTISYTPGWRLFIRWKGSIWKSICVELLLFLILWYAVRMIYMVLQGESKARFENLSLLFDEYTKQFPLTFLLGFYVSMIATRWWTQFMHVTWPDDLLSLTIAMFPGSEQFKINIRHTVARYLNLTTVLCWRDVSTVVRERFPTMEHIVGSGLMNDKELELYNNVTATSLQWQLPLQWIQRIIEVEYLAGKVPPPLYGTFLNELKNIRECMRILYCHDWVPVPLVYTQVVAIATYSYFGFALIGRQFLDPETTTDKIDLYFPFFTVVQFLFYVGWFRVGQDLLRPFGSDDDDIELSYVLDRNVAMSFSLVHQASTHELKLDTPEVWRTSKLFASGDPSVCNCCLAHTKLSRQTPTHPPKQLSTVAVKKTDAETILICEEHSYEKNRCRACQEPHKPNRRDF